MRQFFLSFLLVMTAAVSLTLGGLALMNHDAGMLMNDPASCVIHCIQSSIVGGVIPVVVDVQPLFLFVVAILATFALRFVGQKVGRRFFRVDNDVGKILLQRQLSTVIIRD